MNDRTKQILQPILTTVIGGIVFLIPLTVIIGVLGKGLVVSTKATAPIAKLLPMNSFAGFAIVQLLAIIGLFLICYVAGKLTRLAFGKAITESVESKLTLFYPRYTVIKAMTQALRSGSGGDNLNVVLAQFDDSAQIGFEVERGESGLVTVFLPGSPDPWSGSVVHMKASRVKALDANFHLLTKSLKAMGKGTAAVIDASMKQ